jgi:hypothetical protein
MQLPLNFEEANKRRDKGIKQALDHAEHTHNNWVAIAYNFLLKYAVKHKEFMTEDVREASIHEVPEPPSKRAWGGVIVAAVKSKIIKRKGYKPTKNPKAHGTPASLWEVLI